VWKMFRLALGIGWGTMLSRATAESPDHEATVSIALFIHVGGDGSLVARLIGLSLQGAAEHKKNRRGKSQMGDANKIYGTPWLTD
jgi:hypothetical protein